ncbi:hypothetical protein [Burkholderia glumae]
MNRVLVVDDHLDDRSLLAEFLRQQGFRVFMASDGLTAWPKPVSSGQT